MADPDRDAFTPRQTGTWSISLDLAEMLARKMAKVARAKLGGDLVRRDPAGAVEALGIAVELLDMVVAFRVWKDDRERYAAERDSKLARLRVLQSQAEAILRRTPGNYP